MAQMKFKRYETKYRMNEEQYRRLQTLFQQHMVPDEYGRSTIYSLYFDTPDYLLIRRSIEHPVYKEKIRLRSYGSAGPETKVFLELKKKYKKVVYMRRLSLTLREALEAMLPGRTIPGGQIARELEYTRDHYPGLVPKVLISYDREAWYGRDDGDFRITFDRNITFRDRELSLERKEIDEKIIQPGEVLMEIKTGKGIPLWMTGFMTQEHIYKARFTKYGNAFRMIQERDGVTDRVRRRLERSEKTRVLEEERGQWIYGYTI